jgi:creatinine amidohydrolase/Fe(II)-dependent formamide hydrolase-like protein
VEEALKRTDIVIVPVSSTESHGPHLPLASDAINGTEMARRTVRMLAGGSNQTRHRKVIIVRCFDELERFG